MKKVIITLMLMVASWSAQAQKQQTGFTWIRNDIPDPAKAILVVTSNCIGSVYLTPGSTAYPINLYDLTDKKRESTTRGYYFLEPGEYEFITFVSGSTYFPFKGSFRLEAGKAYFLGYIEGVPAGGRAPTCELQTNPERLAECMEKFQQKYPQIFSAVKGEMEPVAFLPTQKMRAVGNARLDETFADNSRGWPTSDGKSYVANNSLIIENNATDSCVLSLPVDFPKSFDVRLETTWTGGNNSRAFGLVLGFDNVNNLRYYITNNGHFSVQRWFYPKYFVYPWPLFAKEWHKYDCINTGNGAKNEIRVQNVKLEGTYFWMTSVFINDVMVARNTYKIDVSSKTNIIRKGVMGIISYGPQNIAVNRLTFSELKEKGSQDARVVSTPTPHAPPQSATELTWRDMLKQAISANPANNWDNGDRYKGQAMANGMGAYLWSDGTMYYGSWVENKRTGYGIYITPDGYTVLNCPDCKYYAGNWSNSEKSGTGSCYDATGKLLYRGEFKDDRPVGTYPSTDDNAAYKFELFNYDNGKCIGETYNGRRHGYGIYVWQTGNLWFGWWKDGLRDGAGLYIYNNGNLLTGTWKGDTHTP